MSIGLSIIFIFATLSLNIHMPVSLPFGKNTFRIIKFFLLFFLISIWSLSVNAQVSLPERNPLKLSFRGGMISNNHDQAAELRSKSDNEIIYTINTDYAALGEVELGIDVLRFRGVSLGLTASGMYARPELKSAGLDGVHRVGMTQVEIAKASMIITFNGSDPYTMFELPYHSNKEAVLGISGMIIRTENTTMTNYATDTLGISKFSGEYCQAIGLNVGWNWRLGESGWVVGINANLMFVLNKSHMFKVETDDLSLYSSGYLDFAPRTFTGGIGYHF